MDAKRFPVLKIRSNNPDKVPCAGDMIVELDGQDISHACLGVILHPMRAEEHQDIITADIRLYVHVDIELPADVRILPVGGYSDEEAQ